MKLPKAVKNIFPRTKNHPVPINQKPFIYCALGDSTAAGVGASSPEKAFPAIIHNALQLSFPNTEYHNLGVDAARLEHVLSNQLDRAIELQPDLVTISIGANNIRHGTRSATFERQIRMLFSALTEHTSARIAINNIPNFMGTSFVPYAIRVMADKRARKFNEIMRLASTEFNVYYVDIYSQIMIYNKTYELVSDDGYHPSDIGYALWANTMITHMQDFLFPNRHDSDKSN